MVAKVIAFITFVNIFTIMLDTNKKVSMLIIKTIGLCRNLVITKNCIIRLSNL